MQNRQSDISKFFIAGINYKKSDATTRGLYAVSPEQYASILAKAPQYGIKELFVLSTCNRTEIYGFAEEASLLSELLCSQTIGDLAAFNEIVYSKQGKKAIEHLFNVAAGLDSQILGDYEIVGQIKQAVKFSKENNCIGATMDRLVNAVLQSSKEIKNNTVLSGGTVSVSFAAVQYIKEMVPEIADKKIVLLGTGKIGRITCKNLVDYLGARNITLINRTEEKAAALSEELDLSFAPAGELAEQVISADIILVATNSSQPVILKSHLENTGHKLIIDLSVPCNVETQAQRLSNITFINVDELSKIKDETLQKREAEVPKANAIIIKHIAGFFDWHARRRHVPVLKAIKIKLEQIHTCNLYTHYSPGQMALPVHKNKEKVQKIINGTAVKMREQNQQGCYYIEAINEYLATGTN
jgi:glutamyl-tRNA reductase